MSGVSGVCVCVLLVECGLSVGVEPPCPFFTNKVRHPQGTPPSVAHGECGITESCRSCCKRHCPFQKQFQNYVKGSKDFKEFCSHAVARVNDPIVKQRIKTTEHQSKVQSRILGKAAVTISDFLASLVVSYFKEPEQRRRGSAKLTDDLFTLAGSIQPRYVFIAIVTVISRPRGNVGYRNATRELRPGMLLHRAAPSVVIFSSGEVAL